MVAWTRLIQCARTGAGTARPSLERNDSDAQWGQARDKPHPLESAVMAWTKADFVNCRGYSPGVFKQGSRRCEDADFGAKNISASSVISAATAVGDDSENSRANV